MTPTLIVIALLALGVGIVVLATRNKTSRPYEERLEQDTAWNDPLKPGAPAAPETTSQSANGLAEPDPFPASPTDRPLP